MLELGPRPRLGQRLEAVEDGLLHVALEQHVALVARGARGALQRRRVLRQHRLVAVGQALLAVGL